ncbi:MAG: FAD-dependent oxidoreductase [Alphaproteobacteria bacterium]|nr:FAD-dependent oxidoreductase [Alphaproteobacteria bacterium]
MTGALPPVIIGAGPAGIRAAAILAAAGVRPIIIDEAPRAGGQIYRRPPQGFTRPAAALYGFEARKAERLHRLFDDLAGRVDHRPDTLVWDLTPGELRLSSAGRASVLRFGHLILATGARDRIIPIPGWTMPGVYTLGGAQIALKYQGCAIGRRVAFLGTGPLLYLVAYQYAKAGAEIAAVLDTAPFTGKARAAPALLAGGSILAKGLYYMAALARRGIALKSGIVPQAIDGADGVAGLSWRDAAGAEHRLACDAVGLGFGLEAETQLADLAGIPFAWDEGREQHLPECDAAGRTALPGLYLAGDGAGIAGAEAAELSGERAALSLLEDCGKARDRRRARTIDTKLHRLARFRAGLEAAFPFPSALAAGIADATILCRCEAVTAGAFRAAARGLGAAEINRAKAFSRVGMGRCQGRVCGAAAACVLAAAIGIPRAEAGRMRGQAPVKPIAMDMIVEAS